MTAEIKNFQKIMLVTCYFFSLFLRSTHKSILRNSAVIHRSRISKFSMQSKVIVGRIFQKFRENFQEKKCEHFSSVKAII